MSIRVFSVVASVLVGIFVLSQSVYIVSEIQRAVSLRVGKIEDPDISTGLHFKWPFVDEVRIFDARVLTLDARPERFLTVEKKSMLVDSFAKWRIIDVRKYYQATSGLEASATNLLAQRINEGLRNEFATRTLQEVVSGEREELMTSLKDELNTITQTSMGVEIIDVRVKQIDFPKEVSSEVYNRMNAERQREAAEHRALGHEEAEKTRAEADREITVIEAKAYREAELNRGAGDAKAAAIYSEAYGHDPEFYAFTRSLAAYRGSFSGKDDVMLVDPDSDFFSYFKNKRAASADR